MYNDIKYNLCNFYDSDFLVITKTGINILNSIEKTGMVLPIIPKHFSRIVLFNKNITNINSILKDDNDGVLNEYVFNQYGFIICYEMGLIIFNEEGKQRYLKYISANNFDFLLTYLLKDLSGDKNFNRNDKLFVKDISTNSNHIIYYKNDFKDKICKSKYINKLTLEEEYFLKTQKMFGYDILIRITYSDDTCEYFVKNSKMLNCNDYINILNSITIISTKLINLQSFYNLSGNLFMNIVKNNLNLMGNQIEKDNIKYEKIKTIKQIKNFFKSSLTSFIKSILNDPKSYSKILLFIKNKGKSST